MAIVVLLAVVVYIGAICLRSKLDTAVCNRRQRKILDRPDDHALLPGDAERIAAECDQRARSLAYSQAAVSGMLPPLQTPLWARIGTGLFAYEAGRSFVNHEIRKYHRTGQL